MGDRSPKDPATNHTAGSFGQVMVMDARGAVNPNNAAGGSAECHCIRAGEGLPGREPEKALFLLEVGCVAMGGVVAEPGFDANERTVVGRRPDAQVGEAFTCLTSDSGHSNSMR